MRLGKARPLLDGAGERAPRVCMTPQLAQHEAGAIPRLRVGGLGREYVAVRVECQRQPAASLQQQREIEAHLHKAGAGLECEPERLERGVLIAGVAEGHAEVVPGERVVRVGAERATIALRRIHVASRLVERNATFVPEFRTLGPQHHEAFVEIKRRGRILAHQVDLGHRLQHERFVLAAL